MEAVICNETALDYWRHNSDSLGSIVVPRRLEPARKGSVHIDVPSALSVADLVSWLNLNPSNVQLLITDSKNQHALRQVSYTSCANPFPSGSFARTRGQMYATSPELTFLLLARKLDMIRLLEVGFELCGTYRMVDGMPVYGKEPLTSAARIKAFANRATGIHGRTTALRACRWLLDGSGSPAETALAIAFVLPYRMGGYGLRNFALNRELALNESAARILGRSTIRPDIYFLQARHPVEYDSPTFHSGREQAEYDERRRNAYDAMNMSVTVLRSRHLLNINLLDEMVRSIRRTTGQWQNRVPADYEARKSYALSEVFRYWQELRDEYGLGSEFHERAARWVEPDSPW